MIKEENRLLYLSVISQSLIDNIDDGVWVFTKKLKQFAKTFLAELLKAMNIEFESPIEVHQLVELSEWVEQMFEIQIRTKELTPSEQMELQYDWQLLLEKHGLTQESE